MIMPSQHTLRLPSYQHFADTIALIHLPISASELHGVMCGYLAAGAIRQGENYIRALLAQRTEHETREVLLTLFGVFTISHQQMRDHHFEFELLLPDDDMPLSDRAQAFSEWCEGFVQGITVSGVDRHEFEEEEAQDALHHIKAFAQMDYTQVTVDEEDEHALMEVYEYARMAVLHIYADIQQNQINPDDDSIVAH